MDFKINIGSNDSSSQRRRTNDIFRRFRHQFTSLLSPTRNRQQFPNLNNIYIANGLVHEELNIFATDQQNNAQFFIGLTGIGKTTTLKGFFSIDGSAAKIIDKSLLLPMFVNGASIYKKEDIEERLGALDVKN
jgi:hypothetical protein